MNADRGDLAVLNPDACVAGHSTGGNSITGQRADEHIFQAAKIPVQIAFVAIEVDNRVPDELTGAVVRDVTASLDLMHLHTALPQLLD